MTSIPMLLMRLEGVEQSYGESSRRDYRDTAAFPSKSAIVGMIGCVMGIPRGDARLREISDAIRIGVRADRPGELFTDYQTVIGNPLLCANGAPRQHGDTITIHRDYLADASFLVAITAEGLPAENAVEFLNSIVDAFKHPVWIPFLGRKCCVMSKSPVPVFTDKYATIRDALTNEPAAKRSMYPLTAELTAGPNEPYNYTRPDELIDVLTHRYRRRRVVLIEIPAPAKTDSEDETDVPD